MTVHFETLGCRLNQDETEGAARKFQEAGFTTDLEPLTANASTLPNVVLSVVNTCTVTGKAEQKARRIIRLLLQKFPSAPVIVTGCYAEVDSSSIKAIYPERISVLPGTKKQFLSLIAALLKEKNGSITASEIDALLKKEIALSPNLTQTQAPLSKPVSQNAFSLYTPVFAKHSRGSVKIQDGCDFACSFCRIHLARGKSVSLSPEEVVCRVKELEENGVNEVVLTGVNLAQYSASDENGVKIALPSLLKKIIAETKKIKIRLSSLYPQSITDELCKVLSLPRVQPFFHLSIQSGSDRILKEMRRPHDVTAVEECIKKLRGAKENPFISCDIIAGFPGETEDDFNLTKKLCDSSRFAWIHAFPFSPRPGTPAASMKSQIPERVKDERILWLTKKAISGKIDYINSFKGKTLSAIVENSRSDRKRNAESKRASVLHAVTENFLHVEFSAEGEDIPLPGEIIAVKILFPLEEEIRAGKEVECACTLMCAGALV